MVGGRMEIATLGPTTTPPPPPLPLSPTPLTLVHTSPTHTDQHIPYALTSKT